MAGLPERENTLEQLLVDLKTGRRRVVSPEEPHFSMLTMPCSRGCPCKTEGNRDIKHNRQDMLNGVRRWVVQRFS
jgi:hypothetical protein